MGNCNTCHAWKPSNWESWRYTDQEAPCLIHKKNTSRDYSCDNFAIVAPSNIKREVLPAGAAAFLDEEDIKDWDISATEIYPEMPVYEERAPRTVPKIEIQEFAHQEEAFDRFKDSIEIGLFFEQGLGKSNVDLRIAVHKYKKGDIDSLLVVAPNGVHKQWVIEQIPLWLEYYDCPYEVQILGGKAGKTSRPFRKKNALHVVVVNIDTFSTPKKWEEIALWANHNKTFITLDEATTIKSIKSQRTQRMLYSFNSTQKRGKAILKSVPRSVARSVLTGTPVTEGPFDLWSICEFLRPNFFGRNYYSFQAHYGLYYTMIIQTPGVNGQTNLRSFPSLIKFPIWEQIRECKSYNQAFAEFSVTEDTYRYIMNQERYDGPYRYAEELKKLIEPIAMFKTLEECVDMPGKNYERKILDMAPEQLRLYREMENELLATYDQYEATASSKMIAYIRLQQITSGFISATKIMNEETDIIPSREIVWIGSSNPKLDSLYMNVESDIPVCPVIIVTRFSAEAARIYDDLSSKMKCALYTGWKKMGSIEDFQAGKYDVLIANERAISRGFNLQISHSTHFYSNLFGLEDRLQTESRTYRISQFQKTRYTDYVFLDTVDMKVIAALRQKRGLLDYMRGVTVKSFLCDWDEVAETEYAGVRF